MTSGYSVLIRVRYSECDAQNVVFNARYADYVDLAVTEFMRDLFGGYAALLEQGMDCQVVRLAIDWKSPARFDDVLSIGVETLRVGNSSYSFKLEICEFSSNRAIAIAEITYVMVTPLQHKKVAIPDNIRAALLTGMNDKIVNYSGLSIEIQS